MNFETLFADRTRNMGANIIREILKVVSQPGMISLAGGYPAPESYPFEVIRILANRVLEKYGTRALQYDMTEGFIPLREALVPYLAKKGIQTTAGGICITSGSQGLLDALGKVLITPGDIVAVEAPTYLGALSAFNPYGPRYQCAEMDDEGILPEALEKILASGTVKLVYLVPTFQNPTGRCLGLARRHQIAELITRYDVLLCEDDPYSDLRYRGEALPTLHSLIPERTIYTTTLSKVFAPGLRLGVCVAPEPVRRWLVLAKQGVDLNTSTLNQAMAAEYLLGGYLDQQIPKIISLYKPKQEAMLAALDRFFPETWHYSRPEGGMFIWAEGPQGTDTEKLYWKCIDRKAAFVPGKFFFPCDGDGLETMRLNYTMSTEAEIQHGIQIIGETIKEGF
ncbi:MAG TPA: PLP-dependent aminotransferase family protein [bacterium]|nr:PLP-dependent aminotransferase family protein [bacterium]HQG44433.1 PLP-dependent aminotransferase family protein [bacterium]HQI48353.1 PLP-dependent aminotransferase family protein [bacterium]HQJ63455.1 PLP-dependent aminotransferase family protein [bacterium]